MNSPPYAERAARLLRREHHESSTTQGHDRGRGVATIERALKARGRRKLLTWSAGAALMALGSLGFYLGNEQPSSAGTGPDAMALRLLGSPTGAGAVLSDAQGSRPLNNANYLSSGSRIVVDHQGGAGLQLSSGTLLNLDGDTRFSVKGAGSTQRFELRLGGLFAKVAKLKPGERFIVDTPDAAIEVRGTAFKLTVLGHAEPCRQSTRTRLEVSEGLVTVYARGSTSQVGAGQIWPPECQPEHERRASAAPARTADGVPATETASSGAEALPRAPAIQASQKSAAHKVSSLGDQNDLFAEAVRARTQGELQQALALYRKLETTYPESPLAQNASAERMRLLLAIDRDLARRQATHYLERYPDGFAQAEARRVLGER